MSIQFGVRIPPCGPIDSVADCISKAERMGIDTAWIPDSQLLWRDAYAALSLGATRTQSIRLGTCVTNVVTRDPTVLASAANTVNELAPGRFILGIGTGDSSVKLIGKKPSRRREMKQSLSEMRALWRGEKVDFDGRSSHLTGAAGNIPIYMASSGPKNLAFAGRWADGVILLAGVAPGPLARSIGHIRQGSSEAERPFDELDITVGAFCQITDDVERDARILKPVACAIAQLGGQEFLAEAGIELPDPGYIEGVYPDMTHAEDWSLAVEKAGRYVSDEDAVAFAKHFCLFGTPEEIIEGVRAAAAIGATSFYLRHVGNYSLPYEMIEGVGSEVIPRISAAEFES